MFQSGRLLDGFSASDGTSPMLKGNACVAQIRIFKSDDFVAERGHDPSRRAVFAHFQIEPLVNVNDEIFERRR